MKRQEAKESETERGHIGGQESVGKRIVPRTGKCTQKIRGKGDRETTKLGNKKPEVKFLDWEEIQEKARIRSLI